MKQILLSFLLLSLVATCFAQYADTTKHILATDYLKKSKKQKTAGWILLGGGTLITGIGVVVGAATAVGELIYGESKSVTAGEILIPVGLLSMAGSIPLFIASGKNRRKAAASVSFKMENATNIYQCSLTSASYPAVAIHIRL